MRQGYCIPNIASDQNPVRDFIIPIFGGLANIFARGKYKVRQGGIKTQRMVRISARDFATIENGRYGQFVEEHMNTQEKEIGQAFIEHARYLLQQEYGPRLQRCLEEMSEEDLWWRPNEHCNSAGNLILHVCGNARQWIISGVGGTPDTRQRSKEFAERGP